MDKKQRIIDLRAGGLSYRKIAKKVGMCPRSVILIWWKSHLTEKELKAFNRKMNDLKSEAYKILRATAEKKGLTTEWRSRKR